MGPLTGTKIVELAGVGPGPFAGMVLSDMGADVLRVDRAAEVPDPDEDRGAPPLDAVLRRGRRSVGIDLKHPDGVETVLRLIAQADALIEGFRPGVAERLGVGPDECRSRNPRLVYSRMTGWGQDGPLASAPGHDINYIALTGVLDAIGRVGDRPVPPLNLVADFGGGGMLLAFGVVCGLLEAQRSGEGQVVDAAMVDGAGLLMAMIYGMRGLEFWKPTRGVNLLDGGAHFYEVYETADGGHVAVGAIEAQFYAEFLQVLGLDAGELPDQLDHDRWPAMKERVAAVFRTRTRDEWVALFEGTQACVTPVLSMDEAPHHPHNAARGSFVEIDGLTHPAPAPRFSRTPGAIAGPPAHPGDHTDEALLDWGFEKDEITRLRDVGAVR